MEKNSIITIHMSKISSVNDLISLWPNRKALAGDLEVTVDRVHKWARVNSIPAKYHGDVLDAALMRDFAIDAENLIEMHRPRSDAA